MKTQRLTARQNGRCAERYPASGLRIDRETNRIVLQLIAELVLTVLNVKQRFNCCAHSLRNFVIGKIIFEC